MSSMAGVSPFDAIATDAECESPVWGASLRPAAERDQTAVFGALVRDTALILGLETIYEGYLVHYGRARLFAPPDEDTALLLGDYLYAHGLVRIAATGVVAAVHDLAELISLCAQLRGDGRPGDGAAWAATAALLAEEALAAARASLRDTGDAATLEALARDVAGDVAVDEALATHARLLAAGSAAGALDRAVR